MRVRAFAVFVSVALIGGACSDNNNGVTIPSGLEIYTAQLNGANEAPTAVTTTAAGHAIVTVMGDLISWKVDIDAAIDSMTADGERLDQRQLLEGKLARNMQLAGRHHKLRSHPAVTMDAEHLQVFTTIG